jgi:hypothetical protein
VIGGHAGAVVALDAHPAMDVIATSGSGSGQVAPAAGGAGLGAGTSAGAGAMPEEEAPEPTIACGEIRLWADSGASLW